MRAWISRILLLGMMVSWMCAAEAARAAADYKLFETVPVRPLALSADGKWLYAVNTPDDRLEIFEVGLTGLELRASVSVGMRPVALAIRRPGEVWVINHLSDSVSIVDTTPGLMRVTRTLLVGDEPRDIVFAGPDRDRAFITTAHRGQNSSVDPESTEPGAGRADVWVFDADRLGDSAGGNPLGIVTLFSDTPRALAATPDGKRVYVAAFNSGNQTTTVDEGVATPFQEKNQFEEVQPHTGLIAEFRNGKWIDSLKTDVTKLINFSLPDYDVFALDAMAPIRPDTAPVSVYSRVGTTLFNMAVNPRNGALYVSNTQANNITRFEGPGLVPGLNTTVRGAAVQSRITVIKGGAVTPIHLNKHIDYTKCCAPVGNAEARKSLAFPREMAVSSDGSTLYVTAFGSGKVGVFRTAELESNGFTPSESKQIVVGGGGPVGLILDERRQRLYVETFFDNAVKVIDLRSRLQIDAAAMHTPESKTIIEGRPFLYDALQTSSHGDSACGSCHVDGDMDHLAWDLGDPTVKLPDMPGTSQGLTDLVDPFGDGTVAFAFGLPDCTRVPARTPCVPPSEFRFHSDKGPMTTQTLRGMDNNGSMHWRGDRTAGKADDPGAQPNRGMFDEHAAFVAFNVAFPGLLGRDQQLPAESMNKFTDFVLQMTMPPNPHHNLDNSLTAQQKRGRDIYFGDADPANKRRTDTVHACQDCHRLDPEGNSQFNVEHPGFFGTDGRFSFENLTQLFKVPQLRNLYQKVGMFGMAADRSRPFAQNPRTPFVFHTFMGDQIRGFGFQHNGEIDTIDTFLQQSVFINLGPLLQPILAPLVPQNVGAFPPFIPAGTFDPTKLPPGLGFLALLNDPFYRQIDPATGKPIAVVERAAVEAFLLAFPTNLAPIVGQQVTLGSKSGSDARKRFALLKQRAAVTDPVPECDLIGKGRFSGDEIGYLYNPATDRFRSSAGGTIASDVLEVLTKLPAHEVTFTCVPPGSGEREALTDVQRHSD